MYLHLRMPVFTGESQHHPLWRVYHDGRYLGEMHAGQADTVLTEFSHRTGISYFDLDAQEVEE